MELVMYIHGHRRSKVLHRLKSCDVSTFKETWWFCVFISENKGKMKQKSSTHLADLHVCVVIIAASAMTEDPRQV